MNLFSLGVSFRFSDFGALKTFKNYYCPSKSKIKDYSLISDLRTNQDLNFITVIISNFTDYYQTSNYSTKSLFQCITIKLTSSAMTFQWWACPSNSHWSSDRKLHWFRPPPSKGRTSTTSDPWALVEEEVCDCFRNAFDHNSICQFEMIMMIAFLNDLIRDE